MSSTPPTLFERVMKALQPLINLDAPGLVSDIYFSASRPVYVNFHREWFPVAEAVAGAPSEPLTREQLAECITYCTHVNTERSNLMKDLELKLSEVTDFAIDWPAPSSDGAIGASHSKWRLRAHVGHSSLGKSLCVRVLPRCPLPLVTLGFHHSVVELVERPNGLMLVCGATGGGKSTTIAALLDHYCKDHRGHVATLENPIEYVLDSGNLANRLITQQWVGYHTPSWKTGILDTLRDQVDLIVIGEIREIGSLRAAVQVANSGHLVIASTHHDSAVRVLHHLVSLFPALEQDQARRSLAECLIGVLCQNLLPSTNERRPVVPCYELFRSNEESRRLLGSENFSTLDTFLQDNDNCTSWQKCLDELHRRGTITEDTYARYSR